MYYIGIISLIYIILSIMIDYIPSRYGILRGGHPSYNYHSSCECYLFECSHCGHTKLIRKPLLLNMDRIHWSDNKIVGGNIDDISFIQRCPHCGKYYFVTVEDAVIEQGESCDDGYMEIEELTAVCNDDFLESIAPECKASLLMQYVHTYNDKYRRNPIEECKAPYVQSKKFTDAVLFLTSRCRIPGILIADLYRQAGMFKKSLEYAADIADRTKGKDLEVLDRTRYLAIKGDVTPFVMNWENEEF